MTEKIKVTDLIYRLTFVVLEILRANDGRMSRRDLLDELRSRKDAEIAQYEKLTDTPWENNVDHYCTNFVLAGFLKRGGGVWHLTTEGENAMNDGEDAVIQTGKDAFKELQKRRNTKSRKAIPDVVPESNSAENAGSADGANLGLEEHQARALDEIQKYIRALGAYEFQNLCAALLRGIGYYVRDVATPGPDGGVDILAYSDPLGARPPRVKVQVKRYQKGSNISVKEVRELAGLLGDGDIGIFITTSGFTSGCRDAARNSGKHLELMDLPRFIELWRETYKNIAEEDRAMLPLAPVYFLNKKGTDE